MSQHFETFEIIPPEGIDHGRLESLNGAFRETSIPANKLRFGSFYDSYYHMTVLVVSDEQRITSSRVTISNKVRVFLKKHFEDLYPLFKCERCHALYYEEEVKAGHCPDVDCQGTCHPTE